jgi:hypothetical protein
MDTQKISLKVIVLRFVRAVRIFASSEVGWEASLPASWLYYAEPMA